MASVLAAALAVPEPPALWEDAHAVNEEKLIQGQLVQLMTTNKSEAIRAVQRLHRNLGHPTTTAGQLPWLRCLNPDRPLRQSSMLPARFSAKHASSTRSPTRQLLHLRRPFSGSTRAFKRTPCGSKPVTTSSQCYPSWMRAPSFNVLA